VTTLLNPIHFSVIGIHICIFDISALRVTSQHYTWF